MSLKSDEALKLAIRLEGTMSKSKPEPATNEAATLEQIQQLWTRLDRAERMKFLDWSKDLCATCGRRGAWEGGSPSGIYCDACCDEFLRPRWLRLV